MGNVESLILEYIKRRLETGNLLVPRTEIMDALGKSHPEFRHRRAFAHGLDRLQRRHVINGIDAPDGVRHYFIGNYASAEMRQSLGL
jgi:hypothetical protein